LWALGRAVEYAAVSRSKRKAGYYQKRIVSGFFLFSLFIFKEVMNPLVFVDYLSLGGKALDKSLQILPEHTPGIRDITCSMPDLLSTANPIYALRNLVGNL
jgi:hypothetical protein